MAEDIFTQGYSLISGQVLSWKNLRRMRCSGTGNFSVPAPGTVAAFQNRQYTTDLEESKSFGFNQ